jgi:hypothetical protein
MEGSTATLCFCRAEASAKAKRQKTTPSLTAHPPKILKILKILAKSDSDKGVSDAIESASAED